MQEVHSRRRNGGCVERKQAKIDGRMPLEEVKIRRVRVYVTAVAG